jgi:hypothetical protein
MVGLAATVSPLLNYDFRHEENWTTAERGELRCAIIQLFLSKTDIIRLFIPNYNHGYIIYFYGVALRWIQKKCISYL